MKLRNKKTGGVIEIYVVKDQLKFRRLDDKTKEMMFGSLAELNEEWEDYEEPKKYWFIDAFGNIVQNEITKHYGDEYTDMTDAYENQKQIGNHFETEEEAEKAVEKLKAWQRLKDKGFKFDGYDVAHNSNGDLCGQLFYNAGDYCIEDVEKDLDLLFGGRE